MTDLGSGRKLLAGILAVAVAVGWISAVAMDNSLRVRDQSDIEVR